jgi:formylglycine-generating enzyme required for sulfatase activity
MIGRLIKGTLIGVVSITLTTLTIDATDNLGNMSDSMIGSALSGLFPNSEDVCPEGMVEVVADSGAFCIDIYEASPSQECVYDDPSYLGETQSNINQASCVPVSQKDHRPWTNVSQHQAIALCAKAGKHLATPKEWYAASLGTPDSKERCNVDSSGKQVTGKNTQCVSYAGVYDMVGNVWEWVYGTVEEGKYQGRDMPQEGYVQSVDLDGVPKTTDKQESNNLYGDDYFWVVHDGSRGMFRGGFWGVGERSGIYALYAGMDSNFSGVGVGFRCAK